MQLGVFRSPKALPKNIVPHDVPLLFSDWVRFFLLFFSFSSVGRRTAEEKGFS